MHTNRHEWERIRRALRRLRASVVECGAQHRFGLGGDKVVGRSRTLGAMGTFCPFDPKRRCPAHSKSFASSSAPGIGSRERWCVISEGLNTPFPNFFQIISRLWWIETNHASGHGIVSPALTERGESESLLKCQRPLPIRTSNGLPMDPPA